MSTNKRPPALTKPRTIKAERSLAAEFSLPHDELSLTDLFCGGGGSSHGGEQVPGIRTRMAANHWRLAVDTHNTNHPDADHDCFAAGTLVLTSTGPRPIEEISVGELVLTHRGRWRPVVRKFTKTDDTVTVKSAMHAAGIEATGNHEFWTRRMTTRYTLTERVRDYGEPTWQPIEDAKIDRKERAGQQRDMLALPHAFGDLPWIDPPAALGDDPLAAWWLVGRWLGDGSSSTRNHDVTIVCGKHEADALRERIPAAWRGRPTGTAYAFYDYDIKLATWLTEHFGKGAAGKHLPGWVLAMPEARRRALLKGYMSADGSHNGMTARATTVSKALALSIRFLAHSLGYAASLNLSSRAGACSIEGRTVQRRDAWAVHWQTAPTRANSYTDDLHRWGYVQSVEPCRTAVEVYTMEVAEDHSYVADGLVVKNCADISQVDPRRYPATDILWASPSCTHHSGAQGKKRDAGQRDLFDDFVPDEAAERSRATMFDVPRFLEVGILRGKPYKGFVVENVVEVRDWMYYRAWVQMIEDTGYCLHFVYMNSMFAQAGGLPAPQSRDRYYCVGHLKSIPCPDLAKWTRPQAFCHDCGETVRAVQAWKNPERPFGKYRQQYVWRCPNARCHAEVLPAILPAASAIDWSHLGTRIGDRKRPLADKTRARIAAGLRKFARPMPVPQLVPAGGTWNEDPRTVMEVMRTRTTRESEGLMVPPLLVPVEGREGKQASTAYGPLRTQTARNETGVLMPFIAELRGGGSHARSVADALATVTASGNHHGLVAAPPVGGGFVMRNNGSKGDGGEHNTSLLDVLRTLTTTGHQSLVTWQHFIDDYNGPAKSIVDPLPTQTAVDGNALVSLDDYLDIAVEDCLFRMLEPSEIKAATAFAREYVLLGNKREQVRMAGNAVTPPAARDLIGALAEAITGNDRLLEQTRAYGLAA